MNSKTTERFWKCYEKLPIRIKKMAKEAYKQFQTNPYPTTKLKLQTGPFYASYIFS